MSSLSFNKVAGAVLATALAIVGLREVTTGLFSSEAPAKPGYLIEATVEGGEGAAVADVMPDFGTVIPVADIKAGEAVFAKCQSCHNVANGGANGTGPNLWGIVGHKPGSHAGFAYSAAMTEFGTKQGVWDDTHLYEFLKANCFMGVSLPLIRRFAVQLLEALRFLRQREIVHCDLKVSVVNCR